MKQGQVLLDRYEIVEYVNSGGTGDIYLVRHLALNTTMAMKVVNKEEAISQEYINEAHTLKNLRHPQLPRVIDIFETDNELCIIRDYVYGPTLEEYIDSYGPMSFENVVRLAKELLSVLGYLHNQTQPIIYRDLKPSNIIVVEDGALTLIDFGTTRTFVPGKSMDTISLGTQGYAAPEQYGGNQSDARTDIYGLGAVMYFMYTGEHFCDVNENTKFHKFNTESGKKLSLIIKKAMSLMQEDRYQSTDDMVSVLTFNDSKPTELLTPTNDQAAAVVSKTSIGVMGLTRGAGVTHIAFMLASVINKKLGKVCYIERQHTDALTMYERFIEDVDVDTELNSSKFKYRGIEFINEDNTEVFQKLLSSNNVSMVIDYANQHYLVNDFLRNQHKFLVIPSNAWALKNISVIHTMKSYQDVKFIVNLSSDKHANQLRQWLDLPKDRTLVVNYSQDPFGDTEGHQVISQVLNINPKKKRHKLFGVL